MLDFDYYTDKLERNKYDKKCAYCGTIMRLDEDACRVCHKLNSEAVIKLHIQQAKEYEERKKLGVIFTAVSIICLFVTIFLFLPKF